MYNISCLYTGALLLVECTIELTLLILPGDNLNKVRDKRWYRALKNCRITANDILIINLRLVELLYNCIGEGRRGELHDECDREADKTPRV